jgi:hypothetical protein
MDPRLAPPRGFVAGVLPAPVAIEGVPGTPFAVAIVGVPPTVSGPASASLFAGIGSILVSFVTAFFAAVGASGGWGPLVSGAFALLASFAAVVSIVFSVVARRQIRRALGLVTGRGVALAGLICGVIGLTLTVLVFGLSLLSALSSH